jgi:hypothetical protein
MLEGICIRRYLRGRQLGVIVEIFYCLPNKEDADTSVVLRALKTEIVLEVIQSCLRNGIAVEIVLVGVSD